MHAGDVSRRRRRHGGIVTCQVTETLTTCRLSTIWRTGVLPIAITHRSRRICVRGGFGVPIVTCPSCGSPQECGAGVGGFRCKSCQRDTWIIRCFRCREATAIFGVATGAGALNFQCQHCHRNNTVQKTTLRSISAEARRFERVAVETRRRATAQQKAARAHQVESRGRGRTDKR
jgi:hypothetical protein